MNVRAAVPLWAFRLLSTIQAAAMTAQAVLAGSFLGGHYPALATHALVGGILVPVTFLELLCALALAWPAQLARWPAAALVGILLGALAQLGLGYGRSLTWHVPLGVGLVSGSVAVWLWGWTSTRTPLPRRTGPGSGDVAA